MDSNHNHNNSLHNKNSPRLRGGGGLGMKRMLCTGLACISFIVQIVFWSVENQRFDTSHASNPTTTTTAVVGGGDTPEELIRALAHRSDPNSHNNNNNNNNQQQQSDNNNNNSDNSNSSSKAEITGDSKRDGKLKSKSLDEKKEVQEMVQQETERNRLDPRRDVIFIPSEEAHNIQKNTLGLSSFYSSASNTASASLYSDHHCRGNPDDKVLPLYAQRTCLLRNVYLDPTNGVLHYFASPFYSNVSLVEEEIATAIGYIHAGIMDNRPRIERQMYQEQQLRYYPIIHVGTEPPAASNNASSGSVPVMALNHSLPENQNSHTQSQIPVVLLYMWSYDFNFGHFMWDDVFALHAMLETFGLWNDIEPKRTYRHVPVMMNGRQHDPFYRCTPPKKRKKNNPDDRWKACAKGMKRFMPDLLGVELPVPGTDGDPLTLNNLYYDHSALPSSTNSTTIVATPPSSSSSPPPAWVRIPWLIVGAGRMANFACRGECVLHRTGQWYRARTWIFQNVLGDERGIRLSRVPVTEPLITVSLPVGNTHAGVEQFTHIIPALQQRFGKDRVTVIDMATLSIADQVLLAARSAVFLTNHGGGSASSVFLQRGSTCILFHQIAIRHDESFYASQGYMHAHWLFTPETSVETVVKHVERGLARLNLLDQIVVPANHVVDSANMTLVQ